jgi:hypothetical protein
MIEEHTINELIIQDFIPILGLHSKYRFEIDYIIEESTINE